MDVIILVIFTRGLYIYLCWHLHPQYNNQLFLSVVLLGCYHCLRNSCGNCTRMVGQLPVHGDNASVAGKYFIDIVEIASQADLPKMTHRRIISLTTKPCMYLWWLAPVSFTTVSSRKCTHSGLILGLRPANKRRHYKVTPSLSGWVQT